ncbi:hypothetical protein CRG86_000770 [Photobacterium leiognathi]|nr:hypothetical protein CRG86_000770 [Photobacterium leiognathi]
MQVVNKQDKNQVVVWSSQDAFVIHLLTLYLQTKLPVHKQCQHVKGHGGENNPYVNYQKQSHAIVLSAAPILKGITQT